MWCACRFHTFSTESASVHCLTPSGRCAWPAHLLCKSAISRLVSSRIAHLYQYRPTHSLYLVIEDATLNTEFNQHYKAIFFQHLDKVITHNTITLELTKTQLQQIILLTEHLAAIIEPVKQLAKWHQEFLTKNDITDHDVLAELQ